ncbi:helix-turn-helix transcriptional regulator [Clostridium sp. UBA5712]|uniref:helix-turn-helix domain-containing protein n=1 Tax=Clostridium sp. UBA5712 TaxID=1946368 RepID=UPI003216F46D
MTIGDKILYLRQKLDMKQKELADKVGITEATLSRYENGKRNPRGDIAAKLAKALGVTTDYLLNENSNDVSRHKASTPTKREQKDHDTFMEDAKALFMNGELDEDDKEKIFKDISDLFWESKKINKEKSSKKK